MIFWMRLAKTGDCGANFVGIMRVVIVHKGAFRRFSQIIKPPPRAAKFLKGFASFFFWYAKNVGNRKRRGRILSVVFPRDGQFHFTVKKISVINNTALLMREHPARSDIFKGRNNITPSGNSRY